MVTCVSHKHVQDTGLVTKVRSHIWESEPLVGSASSGPWTRQDAAPAAHRMETWEGQMAAGRDPMTSGLEPLGFPGLLPSHTRRTFQAAVLIVRQETFDPDVSVIFQNAGGPDSHYHAVCVPKTPFLQATRFLGPGGLAEHPLCGPPASVRRPGEPRDLVHSQGSLELGGCRFAVTTDNLRAPNCGEWGTGIMGPPLRYFCHQ